jgi:FKBP-type peptidyl-prolyl cis-trans isomerase FkpA
MKFVKPTLVALALISVFGCQEDVKTAEAKTTVLETEAQKQAYSLGASIGAYIGNNLKQQAELGLELDQGLITNGFVDSLAGNSLVSEEEMRNILTAMNTQMNAKQQEQAAKLSESSLAEGQDFLAENAKKSGVQVTESGIQYVVITEGEGAKPKATDTVTVHYKGTLIDGEQFDSSYDRGEPAVFPLNRVISGWTEGVQLMSVGAKYKFTIPSDLAYGTAGSPPRIPGNSVLEFEIELLEIQSADEPANVSE